MNIILASILLFSSLQLEGDTSMVQQSKNQAALYMQQLNSNADQEIYLWALMELVQSHSEVQNYIKQQIREKGYTQPYYRPFLDNRPDGSTLLKELVFTTGSPALFIKLLLDEQDASTRKQLTEKFSSTYGWSFNDGIDYQAITNSILQDSSIDSDMLPNDTFSLTHLFLIMDASGFKMLSNNYFNSILDKWQNQVGTVQSMTLKQQLLNISYFRISYLLDQYEDTKRFYSIITDDNLIPNSPRPSPRTRPGRRRWRSSAGRAGGRPSRRGAWAARRPNSCSGRRACTVRSAPASGW